jgi:hypothetical protein
VSPLPTAPAPPPAHDAHLRTTYLAEVLRTLYPSQPESRSGGEGSREYLVLPHARRPRLLVPAGSRRAAAAAVRHGTEPRSWRARLVRAAAAAALRTGAAEMLPRDRVAVEVAGSLEHHLQEAVLGGPTSLAIHIGPARANRKPIAQLIDPTGQTTGFVKVGVGPLTRRLVRTETAALSTLSLLRLRQLTVPRVRHAGRWRGHQLLVQSALPVWRRRARLYPERLALAMREVAYCCGVDHGTLATSPYWKQLVERVTTVASQPEGATLASALATLGERTGDLDLRYGAWHGDWAPWNMAVLPETLLVWDWERFTVGVPLGFDAVHYDLQRNLQSSSDAAAAVRATLAATDRLLAPFDVTPPARQATALLYLVDLAARYLTDRQAEAGARLGVLGTWLLPALTHQLENLP